MKRIVPLLGSALFAFATLGQNPQIPTLQVCNGTAATAAARVHINARTDAVHAGNFDVRIPALGCDPAGNGFPTGDVTIGINLSDSSITAIRSISIEQLTTTGKHTPTMYVNGRCTANPNNIPCHFWLMLVDNKQANAQGTADVVSFLVVDKTGKRLSYGTGALVQGDVNVTGTGN